MVVNVLKHLKVLEGSKIKKSINVELLEKTKKVKGVNYFLEIDF